MILSGLDAKNAAAAAEKARNEKYNTLISAADAAFSSKDYSKAKNKYEEAQSVKSKEPYPQTKIDEIKSILADLANKEKELQASNNAIQQAKRNASVRGLSSDRFIELDADEQKLPFDNDHFDFVVAESCLDSMPLDVAKNYISELKRVCSGVIYASLIGPDESMGSNEFEVQTLHEFGTYQTVFNKEKIASLFGSNISNFSYFASISCMDVQSKKIGSKRFHCVIESEKIYG